MIKILKRHEYKRSLWKNGQGSTEEIFISPESAKFPEDNFVFRLSSASIECQNEFSTFLGYQRLLTVIEGKGLLLNDEALFKNEVLKFSGSEKMKCHPCSSKVLDLGLIFNENIVSAEMTILRFRELKLTLDTEKHYFIFCTNGPMFSELLQVQRFETLYLKGESSIKLSSPEEVAVLISIGFR